MIYISTLYKPHLSGLKGRFCLLAYTCFWKGERSFPALLDCSINRKS